MNFLLYIARRLREPSTLAALSALGVLAGIPPGTLDLAVQAAIAAPAVIAMVLPDPAPAPVINFNAAPPAPRAATGGAAFGGSATVRDPEAP